MQLWVALPEADESCEPAFTHTPAEDLPVIEAEGVWMRLVAGSTYGHRSPVATHSPLFFLHAECQTGTSHRLPGGHHDQAVYVAKGNIEHGGEVYQPGQLLVFGDDTDAVITARTPATLRLFGGEPLGERHIFWNFVSSRKDRIEQAKADWAAARFALPPDDNDEWIPLPGSRLVGGRLPYSHQTVIEQNRAAVRAPARSNRGARPGVGPMASGTDARSHEWAGR